MKKLFISIFIFISLIEVNSSFASRPILPDLKFSLNINSQDLDLRGKGMIEFPKEVLVMTDVKTLDISDNNLTNIPSEIQNLKYLTVLKLNGNKIYELPSVVSKLKFLKEIYLDREIWQYRLNEVKKITAARIILVG